MAPHTSWLISEGSILNLPEISWHVQAKAAEERQLLLHIYRAPFSASAITTLPAAIPGRLIHGCLLVILFTMINDFAARLWG